MSLKFKRAKKKSDIEKVFELVPHLMSADVMKIAQILEIRLADGMSIPEFTQIVQVRLHDLMERVGLNS